MLRSYRVLDYMHRAQEAIHDLSQRYAEGKPRYRADVVEGLENAPHAIKKLFDGSNMGKLVVKV